MQKRMTRGLLIGVEGATGCGKSTLVTKIMPLLSNEHNVQALRIGGFINRLLKNIWPNRLASGDNPNNVSRCPTAQPKWRGQSDAAQQRAQISGSAGTLNHCSPLCGSHTSTIQVAAPVAFCWPHSDTPARVSCRCAAWRTDVKKHNNYAKPHGQKRRQ
jgi:energy-coupling factor transporter ATP-binding protein EcfA2